MDSVAGAIDSFASIATIAPIASVAATGSVACHSNHSNHINNFFYQQSPKQIFILVFLKHGRNKKENAKESGFQKQYH